MATGQARSRELRGALLISPEYLALNHEMHERNPRYGTSGGKRADQVHAVACSIGAHDVLDYGCGKGDLRAALVERFSPLVFNVHEYDPAIYGKDEPPAPADLVFCGDVLEHIEPDCLNAVLNDISRAAKELVFLVIATTAAKKTLADGRNAHLIVAPVEWWAPKLMSRWEMKLMRGGENALMFVGAAK